MTTTTKFNHFDEQFLEIAATIQEDGLAIFKDTSPSVRDPYAYTMGLHRLGHPELVMFGLCDHHTEELGEFVFDSIIYGRPLPVGRQHRIRVDDQHIVALDPVTSRWFEADPSRISMWWLQFGATTRPSFVQLVLADQHGLMPWEAACDPQCRAAQPLVADNPAVYPRQRTRQVGRTAKRRRR
jgi:hypothetical protein